MTIHKTDKGINIYVGDEPTTVNEFFSLLKETLIELKFVEDKKDTYVKEDIKVRFATKIGHSVIVKIDDDGVWAIFYLNHGDLRNLSIRLNSGIHLIKSSKDIDALIELKIPESISLFNFFLDFTRVLWEYQDDHKELYARFKILENDYKI
jgi:hypothetical protein